MSIAEIIELVGLIITGIGLIFSIIKWVKELRNGKIQKLVEKYMEEAETVEEYTGEAKKIYVVQKVLNDLKNWTEKDSKKVISYIEECIAFSKKINFKGKE